MDGTITESPGGFPTGYFGTDPNPTAPGIYIGAGGQDCYLNHGGSGLDVDQDWIADYCEYRLAKAFSPTLSMNPSDGCPKGEPYWAVRYFDDGLGLNWGQFVRIAYLQGYYRDCGNTYAHDGDSEFVVLNVGYNSQTRHWEMFKAYLSAHASPSPTNIANSAGVYRAEQFSYPDGVPKRYPRIWVSKKKHANYPQQLSCNEGGLTVDTCVGNTDVGRIRVWESHNIGGFNFFWVNCTDSQNALYSENGRQECFWTGSKFTGWQKPNSGYADPYNYYLMSGAYECWLYDGFNCYYGP